MPKRVTKKPRFAKCGYVSKAYQEYARIMYGVKVAEAMYTAASRPGYASRFLAKRKLLPKPKAFEPTPILPYTRYGVYPKTIT